MSGAGTGLLHLWLLVETSNLRLTVVFWTTSSASFFSFAHASVLFRLSISLCSWRSKYFLTLSACRNEAKDADASKTHHHHDSWVFNLRQPGNSIVRSFFVVVVVDSTYLFFGASGVCSSDFKTTHHSKVVCDSQEIVARWRHRRNTWFKAHLSARLR